MKMRATGMRALGAALMLTSLTAAGVLLSPGVGGAASISTTKFGTLPSPCGKGHDTGATDKGVTNTTINIAYGDDRGFSGLPGLDQEMGDAVKAMVAWCNAAGRHRRPQARRRLRKRRGDQRRLGRVPGVQAGLHRRASNQADSLFRPACRAVSTSRLADRCLTAA